MKEPMTYYEVLEVSPAASPDDIRSAYRQIQSIYDKASLSTYSLFSSEERKMILTKAEQAFTILGNAEKRQAYDEELVARGQLSEKMRYVNTPASPAPVFQSGSTGKEGEHLLARMKQKTGRPEIRELKKSFRPGQKISGGSLKAFRKAADISITDIFESSRVTVSILRAIEEEDTEKLPADIYLKGFLKSYAECLELDPGTVVSGYLAQLSEQ